MHPSDKRIRIAIAILLFLFITAFTPGLRGYIYDTRCWQQWAAFIGKHGLHNAYGSGTNYPPLYQYVLWIFGLLAGNEESIRHNIGYLRVFTLAAEYWALWVVYCWTDRRTAYVFILLGTLLNIGFSYNTIFWGQVDAILAAFVIAAFYYLYTGKHILSAALIVLALNMKFQCIIFIPMWGLMLVAALHRDRCWKKILFIIPVMLALQCLILLPFAFGEAGLIPVWHAVLGLAGTYPYISMDAFNVWCWIVPGLKFYNDRDETAFLFGLTSFHFGLILFFLASFAALWPLLKHTVRTLVHRSTPALSREIIWLSAALITLVFFFFNTRMHERYVHPAFIFLTAYAFYNRRFGLYALFSVAYLLSLEKVLGWFALRNYDTLLFDARFIAALFAGCIAWTFILLYRIAGRDKMLRPPAT